jgi:hypothetical protein
MATFAPQTRTARARLMWHWRALFHLAWPVVLSRAGMVIMMVADVVMVGRYDTGALAALSLGNAVLMPALVAGIGCTVGIVALAARGRLGRLVAVTATSAALVAGLGISSVYAAQFAPVVFGSESEQQFLQSKVSLYDGVEWLNGHLGPNDKVLLHVWSLLYVEVPHVPFGTMGDLLPPDVGRDETRSFVARNNVTHVAVLADDDQRRRQVGYLDARLVARVPVHPVRSRTRDERGPTKEMLVYVLGRR